MKSKLFVAVALIGILLFVAACAPASETDVDDSGQVEAEHTDDDDHEHSSSDDMAAAHDVPQEAAAVPNPISATEDSVATGATLFATNCVVCHGEKGLGDGPSAESLEKRPANLTEAHVQELSDGSLFYIITHGKADTPMPAWENVLEEDDRWNVVNFLRTLADGHEEGEHMEGDEHAEDEHMEEEHTEGDEHAEDEHTEDEHTEGDEHTEDEHSD